MAFAEYPVVSSSGSGGITKVADSIERNALTPADGDIVIQLDNDFLYEWNGSSWAVLADRTWQTAGSILGAKTFDTASRWSVATNQQVFGVTNTITVSYAAPSANRVYTVPDVGADAAYVMSAGNQTLGGTKTFSSAVVITPTTNQLVLGVTNTTTINSVAPSASRVYTIPDAGADASFVMTAGTQSIGGSKTFTSAVTISATTNQLVLGTTNTATISASAPAASRTYTIADPGQSASFVMDRGTQTLQGTYTFTQQTLTQNVTSLTGGVYKITSSGTNPQLYTEYEGTAATAQTWRTGLNVDGLNLGNYVIYDFTSTVTRAALTTAGQLQLPATSNQIRLNTSINALTITSGTSAAARTYTIPDTGTTDTFAMLGGSQTFSGLKTFSSGLAISGGSAANNTIWVASNVLNIRGGTSGTDIYNTSGNVVLDITDAGVVTLGQLATTADAGQAVIINGGLSTGATGTGSAERRLLLNANTYGGVGSTALPSRNSNGGTLGGAVLRIAARTSDTENSFQFATNLIADSNTTATTTIGNASQAGAWAWGPGSSNVNHTSNGSISFTATTTTGNAASIYQSGSRLRLNAGSSGYAFQSSDGVTSLAIASNAGAWEFGASPFAALNHTFNGAIRASVTSSYHAFFRDTAGSDAATPLAVVRPGTENGSEVYISFLESGTSANNGSESGGIRRNAGDTAYEFYNASDANLKNITGTYEGGLQQVVNVPVRRFSWKSSPEREHFRFIAQEVQRQIPTAVFEGSDGFLQLGESDLIPVMWNAIQELYAELQTTKSELNTLR